MVIVLNFFVLYFDSLFPQTDPMLKFLAFIFVCSALVTADFYPEELKITTWNLLSPRYNFIPWFPMASQFLQYIVDAVRYVAIMSNIRLMTDSDVFMFQEVSINAACLTNSSYIIGGGNWEPLSQTMSELGYQCRISFHDQRHWWKYYDYDTCDKYNSYTPTGNVICVKTTSFTNIRFESHLLNNGSALAVALVNYKQTPNVRFVSIHLDSDIQGQRVQEFDETFMTIYPSTAPGTVVVCGDMNTDQEFGSFKHRLDVSGYTDPVQDLMKAIGQLFLAVPSQALGTGWYSNNQHTKNIDFCLVKEGTVIADSALKVGNGALYGYPNATRSGVVDFQLWSKYPAPQPNRVDSMEPYRTGEAMQACGSDHFPYRFTAHLQR